MSQDVLVQQDGPVLRITLNRPDNGNGMTDAMALQFAEVVGKAHETSDMIVLAANGPDFCTGRASSPNAVNATGGAPVPVDAWNRRFDNDVIFNCYWAMRRSPIPVIGKIRGRCMGFGMALAALCDVSFSSDKATYNAPEMNHNILPTMVMSSLFDRVSRNAIAYLVYSTDFVDAQRALSYGLVSTVVADDKLDATLDAFLANMVNTPRPALMGLKEYLRVAPNMDAQGGIDLARSLHAVVNTSGEMKKKKRHH